MTTEELLEKGKKKFGEQFETIARYMAGMLVREADDMTEFVDIIQDLDDSSYDKDNQD